MEHEKTSKNFYITTTLPYVNADPHIGFAAEIVRADIIARYKKLRGYDVFFNTGTDEHGQKLFEAAEKAGKDVKEYVDEYAERFRGLKGLLGLSADLVFIRTTDPRHERAAQEFWRTVDRNGYIYKKNYKTKYCVGCEEEKTDSQLDPNGRCPLHPNRELEIIEEENYFFRFSAFGDRLLKFYDGRPDLVVPEYRLNEMREFVRRGLEDFSISRLKSKMSWGIPVPGDDEHVMYVWFDALVNYISTLGWPEDAATFERYWENGEPTQYCGKDNTRFQSVMWQAMLMAAGLPNSRRIVVDGFITAEGGVKMSKSLGNVVSPYDVVAEYGTEALRYYVARELHPFEDSPFSMGRFKEAYNAGLANGLGNLTSRVMKMATSYGVSLAKEEVAMRCFTEELSDDALDQYRIHDYARAIWERIQELDSHIQRTEPFKKIKTDEAGAKDDVHHLLLHLYEIGLLLEPMMPETSAKILSAIRENRMPDPLFMRKD